MSKITVEFDTIEKTLDVMLDGKTMPNVCGVDICSSYDDEDEFRCNIMQQSKDEANGIKTYTNVIAAEDRRSKVEVDIQSFFVKG